MNRYKCNTSKHNRKWKENVDNAMSNNVWYINNISLYSISFFLQIVSLVREKLNVILYKRKIYSTWRWFIYSSHLWSSHV